jgi:hypothetical protein
MYSVLWVPEALDELATIWADAAPDDRSLITDAVDDLDEQLKADPAAIGESREEEFRILISLPIAVQYRVSEPDRLVQVVSVWRPFQRD